MEKYVLKSFGKLTEKHLTNLKQFLKAIHQFYRPPFLYVFLNILMLISPNGNLTRIEFRGTAD